MVSISETSGHGGSFSENASEHDLLHPSLFAANINETTLINPLTVSMQSRRDIIKRFTATWLIILYSLIVIAFEVSSFLLCDVFHVKILGGVDEPFALMTAIHVAIWAITFIYDRYLHFNHHVLRRCGYLQFFTRTKVLRCVPIRIFSLGNASLLLVVAFTGNHPNKGMLPLNRVFQVVASLEVFACLVSQIVYLYYVISFNKYPQPPDVYQEECGGGFTNASIYEVPDIGFKNNECTDDILDKQSEMIRYLQHHNSHLSKTIVHLTEQLPSNTLLSTPNTTVS